MVVNIHSVKAVADVFLLLHLNQLIHLLVVNLLRGLFNLREFIHESFDFLDVQVLQIMDIFLGHDNIEHVFHELLALLFLLVNLVEGLHGVLVSAHSVLEANGVVEAPFFPLADLLAACKLPDLGVHLYLNRS